MANQIITVTNLDKTTSTFIIIDHGNGQFTSMLKKRYDDEQAALALVKP